MACIYIHIYIVLSKKKNNMSNSLEPSSSRKWSLKICRVHWNLINTWTWRIDTRMLQVSKECGMKVFSFKTSINFERCFVEKFSPCCRKRKAFSPYREIFFHVFHLYSHVEQPPIDYSFPSRFK